ncbi:MBL fold metallo-hydrolase [Gemmatimonas sp.]|uniref:MBL fold metallo-hydrolase n=1 Tax=Gemmatimonas sp. TaxID=1962908 RepID=UPI0025BE7588|nr:MBL fold metallo-hydrolase [Gemmatimonas sp.]MCA2990464.1 MBL fold metallo-hydrolase [Gemmatimonas sp.]
MNDRLPAGFPAPLLETRTVGRLTVHAIQAGGQQLDGGAMFGVVPKTLWSRRLEADAKNRIPLGMRCLLIEHDDGLVLLDTGLGNKENAKFHDIYGVENRGDDDRTALEDGLRAAGFTADDVSLVINTHLHFDHAGGNSWRTPSGEVLPTFRRARYLVQAGELDYAEHTNERTAASYFPANWHPVVAAGQFDFVRGEREVRSGVTVRPTPGHTPHHQSVIIRSGGETLCFLGDLIPTSHHLPLPWIMGYDVEPLVTLESKRALLAQALREEWLLVFEHDAHVGFGRLAHDGKSYHLVAAG